MSSIIDQNGLQLESINDKIDAIKQSFRNIYGQDINLDSDTPDGQLINIFAQAYQDLSEFILGVYNSQNPYVAAGLDLDNLCSRINIQRKGGTQTQVIITIAASSAVRLLGLDSQTPFTVSHGVHEFSQISSSDIQVGNTDVLFISKDYGYILINPGDINSIITPMVGVDSATNQNSPAVVGINEENDVSLRLRYFQSSANRGSGGTDSINSAIQDIEGVSDCFIENNRSSEMSVQGTDPHSIWAIVEGGDNNLIAAAIDRTISDGCGMRGNVVIVVPYENGVPMEVHFDRPNLISLHVRLTLERTSPFAQLDNNYLARQIVQNIFYKIQKDF